MSKTPSSIKAIAADAALASAFQQMRYHKLHHLVVMQDSQVIGVVSDRDLFERGWDESLGAFGPSLRVSDVMTLVPEHLAHAGDIRTACQIIRRYQVSAVPVVDGDQLVAIVTESDLLNVFYKVVDGDLDETLEGFSKTLLSHPLVQSTMNVLAGIGI